MARISYRPSPWELGGGLAGGIAQGIGMGAQIGMQREQMEQSKLHQALMLLAQGAKSDDPAMQAWLGQIAQQVGGKQLAGMPPAPPTGPEPQLARAAQKVDALIAMNPQLKEHRDELLTQELGYKDFKAPWRPTPQMILAAQKSGIPLSDISKLNPQQAEAVMQGVGTQAGINAGAQAEARLPFQVTLKQTIGGGSGGHGGRGGGGKPKKSDIVNWTMADGSIKQARYDQQPEGAQFFTNISSKGPGGEESALTASDFAKMIELQKVVDDPAAPTIQKAIAKAGLEQLGVGKAVNPTYAQPPGGGLPGPPVPITKQTKVKKGQAVQPPPGAAPPPAGKATWKYNQDTGQLEPMQ